MYRIYKSCVLSFLSIIIKNSYLIWHIVSSTTGMLNRHNVGFSPDCGYSSFWKYTISSALLLCWLQLYSTTWNRNLYRKFIQYSISQISLQYVALNKRWILLTKTADTKSRGARSFGGSSSFLTFVWSITYSLLVTLCRVASGVRELYQIEKT